MTRATPVLIREHGYNLSPMDATKEIERYLLTGEHDDLFYSAWPGNNLVDRAQRGHAALRRALVAEVQRRTKHVVGPEAHLDLDVIAFTRAKVTPMVQGLFPRREQEVVLDALGRSVVFLMPSNIQTVLAETQWHTTAWDLANLYLESVGAELLSEDAPRLLGLSEETTCYVSAEYFRAGDPLADFVVHEAAHVFHNCKRRTIGLRETRGREWLLQIEFAKRETFAYACEAYSRILVLGAKPAERRRLLAALEQQPLPERAGVHADEYVDILHEAVTARNGWKRILERCSGPRPRRASNPEQRHE